MTTHGGRAVNLARLIQQKFPNEYETWFYFTFGSNFRGENGDGQGGVVRQIKDLLSAEEKEKLHSHKTTPFCWIETSDSIRGIGGRDRLCEWIATKPELLAVEEIKTLSSTPPGFGDAIFDNSPGSCQPQSLEKSC